MTTVVIGGLGPNINSERLLDAELLLGWSAALESKPISFEEYSKREGESDGRALGEPQGQRAAGV